MKTELKVILSLVFVLLLGEAGSRAFESRLSADVRQMLAFEEIPQEIAEAQAAGQTCVLVLGNSLARAAVDSETLEIGLIEKGWPQPKVFYLAPDGSGVNEWTTAYRKHFPSSKTIRPDLLILVTGPGHLLDHSVRSPEKLSAFLAAPQDRGEIFRDWLTTDSERCRFVLAGVSRLFANRDRVRPLMFYNLVPGYEVTAQRLNRAGREGREESVPAVATANRFRTLLDSLDLPADRVILAGAPLPESYRLPEAVLKATSEWGIAVFDDSAAAEWPSEAFPDGYHMGPSAAGVFTDELLQATFQFEPGVIR